MMNATSLFFVMCYAFFVWAFIGHSVWFAMLSIFLFTIALFLAFGHGVVAGRDDAIEEIRKSEALKDWLLKG